ncbi:nitroreductase family protein [Pararhizobium gei]|uniref:nitroreductase family protein n=1 Tax=Pararhizobium gei TaxID=1395951 RepID=UPI0023DADD3F|nr:hypothetical protein [Rhizobium gei]
MTEVASVVREALKADFIGAGQRAGRKKKRVVSAGALHPIKCVIVGKDNRAFVYDDETDAVFGVEARDPSAIEALSRKSASVLPSAATHFLALLADTESVSTVYSNHESLLWRDAGAVLQTLALVSEAFGLGFCPLGILGQEAADGLLPSGHRFLGVGVAAIGRRVRGVASSEGQP